MVALEDAMRQRFEENLSLHLAATYGRPCDSEMRALVRRGVAKAEQYGIISDCGIEAMLEWIIGEGEHFDTDPERPMVLEILNDPALPEPAKLRALADCHPWRAPELPELVENPT
jgi:hypothetical protein